MNTLLHWSILLFFFFVHLLFTILLLDMLRRVVKRLLKLNSGIDCHLWSLRIEIRGRRIIKWKVEIMRNRILR